MADLIVVCPRRPDLPAGEERLRRAALRLAPPELPVREPLLLESAGVTAAVANPTTEGVKLREGGVWLGGLFGEPGSWWQVGGERPEGTYALVRWDADVLEVVADVCATRTLWYSLTDDAFLVSTSQRALVALLGSFELLPEATAGFMATGSPGPGLSWDARLRPLPSDARITLDRAAWRVREDEAPYVLEVAPGDSDDHVRRLREAMATTLSTLNADLDRWVLTISGGLDSRAVLAFLDHRRPDVRREVDAFVKRALSGERIDAPAEVRRMPDLGDRRQRRQELPLGRFLQQQGLQDAELVGAQVELAGDALEQAREFGQREVARRQGRRRAAPSRHGAGRQSARQVLRLQPRRLREALAQAVEPRHLRLQFTQADCHRVQMPLHALLHPLRLLALVGQHDRLQPGVFDRGRPSERREIESQGKDDEQRAQRDAARRPVPPIERERSRTGVGTGDQDDVQFDIPLCSRICGCPNPSQCAASRACSNPTPGSGPGANGIGTRRP